MKLECLKLAVVVSKSNNHEAILVIARDFLKFMAPYMSRKEEKE